jgi:beta-glucanase (GH16 family)
MATRAPERLAAVLAMFLAVVLCALVGTDSAVAAAPTRRILHGPQASHVTLTRTSTAQAVGCGSALIAKPGGGYWQCSFDDEFNGTSLDRSQWTPQTTSTSAYTSGPAGSQACYVDSPQNVSVSGGYLRLTARAATAPFSCAEPAGNFTTKYTAGEVTTLTGFQQTYGRYEVRAKLPTTQAKGLQETFWLWPSQYTYGAWPQSGEVDFAEFYSEYPTLDVPYLHYVYDPASVNIGSNINTVTAYTCAMNYSAFNTYAIEWMPGRMTIYVNGRTCLVDNYSALGLSGAAPFDQPFFVALTQELGVGANAFDPATTPLPATTQVDYVRVWK